MSDKLSYHEGVLYSTITPERSAPIKVGKNDLHEPRFSLELPLDGWGNPKSVLSLLRQVCKNGMVAMGPAFTTMIQTGNNDPATSVSRFIRSYYDEDGYADLTARLTASMRTPASLSEARNLLTLFTSMPDLPTKIVSRMGQTLAECQEFYGLSTLQAIDEKRARLIRVNGMTVYDTINMATEAATHMVASHTSAVKLQGYAGGLLSDTFDLEQITLDDSDEVTATHFINADDVSESTGFGPSYSIN